MPSVLIRRGPILQVRMILFFFKKKTKVFVLNLFIHIISDSEFSVLTYISTSWWSGAKSLRFYLSIPLHLGYEKKVEWQRALEPGRPALWGTRRRWWHSRRHFSLAAPRLVSPGQRHGSLHCPWTECCAGTGFHLACDWGPAEQPAEPASGYWCDEGSGLRWMIYGSSLKREHMHQLKTWKKGKLFFSPPTG